MPPVGFWWFPIAGDAFAVLANEPVDAAAGITNDSREAGETREPNKKETKADALTAITGDLSGNGSRGCWGRNERRGKGSFKGDHDTARLGPIVAGARKWRSDEEVPGPIPRDVILIAPQRILGRRSPILPMKLPSRAHDRIRSRG